MPIYEYKCEECGENFDFLAKRLSQKPEACPHCGAKTFKKQLSTFSANVATSSSSAASSCCPTGTCCPDGACSLS